MLGRPSGKLGRSRWPTSPWAEPNTYQVYQYFSIELIGISLHLKIESTRHTKHAIYTISIIQLLYIGKILIYIKFKHKKVCKRVHEDFAFI